MSKEVSRPLKVEATQAKRLDQFLASNLTHLSRSRIQSIIKTGTILVNGSPARSSQIVRAGDEILWTEPAVRLCESALPAEIPLDVLFEDECMIVLNKPAGLVVHPGAGNRENTLVSALLFHCGKLSAIGGVERPGIVHRLDKETSGCLVAAKTDAAHRSLAAQFAGRDVRKTYLALCRGVPRHRKGVIDLPIARHPTSRKRMAVSESGKGRRAVTEYRVLRSRGDLSLLECRPLTGRTHQIRVHLKHLGTPVAGDAVYGSRGNYQRQMLHAWKLEFQHPGTGAMLAFEAPVPSEFLIA